MLKLYAMVTKFRTPVHSKSEDTGIFSKLPKKFSRSKCFSEPVECGSDYPAESCFAQSPNESSKSYNISKLKMFLWKES